MIIDSVSAFVDALHQSRLLNPPQWEELSGQLKFRFRDPSALAKELMQREWITPYQINQLHQGRGGDLVLGSYVLLERLGKGGMGLVYKARHRRLDRIVALKLIRKELLANPTAVMLFHREILAAAQLSHPNIVLAFDADAVDGVHFYTMEYVEGSTFANLVQTSGPLLVNLACESMRQAALGIQHAFERGVIHRDIKPSNIMLSWTSLPVSPPPSRAVEEESRAQWGGNSPIVKILDMGLARINAADDDPRQTHGSKKQHLMGTPDFMAPEQAADAHHADIRCDLYSLGCTFYYVLAGGVPFPGGTRLEKLMRHRTEEPKPVEELQAQVPREVGDVVRKLMAKRAEDRFQTPHDLAAALAAILESCPTA